MQLVTMLYSINGGSENWNRYVQLIEQLFQSAALARLELTVFCQALKQPELQQLADNYPGVRCCVWELADVPVYQEIISAQPRLPAHGNPSKDSLEFIALMNCKLAFLVKASQMYSDKHFCFIDAGISKILSSPDYLTKQLIKLALFRGKRTIVPGIWPIGPVAVDRVCWRFCGGLLVGHRAAIAQLAVDCDSIVESLLQQHKCTWEVNIWAMIEQRTACNLEWYAADHNDSMLNWDL